MSCCELMYSMKVVVLAGGGYSKQIHTITIHNNLQRGTNKTRSHEEMANSLQYVVSW